MSVLRTEWLSNALGNGAGSAASYALTTPALDIDDYDVDGLMAIQKQQQQQLQQRQQQGGDVGAPSGDGLGVDAGDEGGEGCGNGPAQEQEDALSLRDGLSLHQHEAKAEPEGSVGAPALQPQALYTQQPHEEPPLGHAPSPQPARDGAFAADAVHRQQPELWLQVPGAAGQEPGSAGLAGGGGGGSPNAAREGRSSCSSPGLGEVGAWGDDARTAYLGSTSSARDAAAARAREDGGTGPWKVRPMSAVTPGSSSGGGGAWVPNGKAAVTHGVAEPGSVQRPASAAVPPPPHAQVAERSALAVYPGGPQRVTQVCSQAGMDLSEKVGRGLPGGHMYGRQYMGVPQPSASYGAAAAAAAAAAAGAASRLAPHCTGCCTAAVLLQVYLSCVTICAARACPRTQPAFAPGGHQQQALLHLVAISSSRHFCT